MSVVLDGYLKKKSPSALRAWQKRHFVLMAATDTSHAKLIYYKGVTTAEASWIGDIAIGNVLVVKMLPDKPGRFNITCDGRVYELAADSLAIASQWVNAINALRIEEQTAAEKDSSDKKAKEEAKKKAATVSAVPSSNPTSGTSSTVSSAASTPANSPPPSMATLAPPSSAAGAGGTGGPGNKQPRPLPPLRVEVTEKLGEIPINSSGRKSSLGRSMHFRMLSRSGSKAQAPTASLTEVVEHLLAAPVVEVLTVVQQRKDVVPQFAAKLREMLRSTNAYHPEVAVPGDHALLESADERATRLQAEVDQYKLLAEDLEKRYQQGLSDLATAEDNISKLQSDLMAKEGDMVQQRAAHAQTHDKYIQATQAHASTSSESAQEVNKLRAEKVQFENQLSIQTKNSAMLSSEVTVLKAEAARVKEITDKKDADAKDTIAQQTERLADYTARLRKFESSLGDAAKLRKDLTAREQRIAELEAMVDELHSGKKQHPVTPRVEHESVKQLAEAREKIKELEEHIAHVKAEQEKKEAVAIVKGQGKAEDELQKEKEARQQMKRDHDAELAQMRGRIAQAWETVQKLHRANASASASLQQVSSGASTLVAPPMLSLPVSPQRRMSYGPRANMLVQPTDEDRRIYGRPSVSGNTPKTPGLGKGGSSGFSSAPRIEEDASIEINYVDPLASPHTPTEQRSVVDFDEQPEEINTKMVLKQLDQVSITGKVPISFAVYSHRGMEGWNPDKHNQDRAILRLCLQGDVSMNLFGVADGHGDFGHPVSQFVQKNLPSYLEEEKDLKTNTSEAIVRGFKSLTDKIASIKEMDCTFSGTTCVCALKVDRKLFVANIGDSRAVLCHQSPDFYLTAIPLSQDQKPDTPGEKERLIAAGGRVASLAGMGENLPPRLWLPNDDVPGLGVSRSIGDTVSQTIGVIQVPEVKAYDLQDGDAFAVWASDGIWEFLSNDQVVSLVWNYKYDLDEAAKQLVAEARRQWQIKEEDAIDDITCVIVGFEQSKS